MLPINVFLNTLFSCLKIILSCNQKPTNHIIHHVMINLRYLNLVFAGIKFVYLFFQGCVMLVVFYWNFVLSFMLLTKSNVLLLFFWILHLWWAQKQISLKFLKTLKVILDSFEMWFYKLLHKFISKLKVTLCGVVRANHLILNCPFFLCIQLFLEVLKMIPLDKLK
jgi:hypothetical protein